MIRLQRRYAAWTAADFDSHQVLASIGTPHPAAEVTRARKARTGPIRRAVHAALRPVRSRGLHWPTAGSPHHHVAN